MKTLLGSREHNHLAMASIFLIMVALITGMIGCDGGGSNGESYTLTITSTFGGSVTEPGEGAFIYDEGTTVNLTAAPDAGYQFDDWTGDVNTLLDRYAETTTIKVDNAYSIIANFEKIPIVQYQLTISSTEGGNVTTPGEGIITYDEGTVVNLVATPDDCCRFVSWTGDVSTINDVRAAATGITMNGNYAITATFEVNSTPMVSAGGWYTAGLRAEGTAVAVGLNLYGNCNVSDWRNIVQVSAGSSFTIGLEVNGSVVAAGNNEYGQCSVEGWTNITQVAAGGAHTVGLKSDGTVLAAGDDSYGQLSIGGWTNIVYVAAGAYYTVGVKSDGTVVAVGLNNAGQCDVGGWPNITQADGGVWHTVGLRSDGTVVAAGLNNYGQRDVGSWTNIVQIAAGSYHTVGLKSNGSMVAVGLNDYGQCNVGSWTNIVQVSASGGHTVGLRSDGTVVAVGHNDFGQCDVDDWDLN